MPIKKKSQGLSINVIIIAILGLIVLFTLISIFSKKTSESEKILESCGGKGGNCKTQCDSSEVDVPYIKCQDNQVCCIKIFEKKE